MTPVELLPEGTEPQRPAAIAYQWPITTTASDTMHTDLSWNLAELGAPASTAKDLLRVAAAAYIADRTNSRPVQALQRDLHLSVHLDEPQAWTPDVLNHAVDLLHWLTGDAWTLEVMAAHPTPDPREHAPTAGRVRAVTLLSGGLDSLCGALLRLDQADSTLFLGHVDTANAVSKAQRAVHDQLRERRPELRYRRYALRPIGHVRESSHSRRAHIRGRHPAAAAGGLRRDQAPDPARPATCHPRSQRSGSGGWTRPGRLAGSRPETRATQDGHWPFCAAAEGDRAPAPPACCRGLPCSAPQGLRS
jgi:hypothetical protein